jgi:hypothetical protein
VTKFVTVDKKCHFMPSESKAQQSVMAIAEHNPSKLYKRNRGVLTMSKAQLHDYAASPRKGLPNKVRPRYAER